MKYPKRIYYAEADKALMWDRWQRGESLHAIARHFGRSHSSIQGILSRSGGIRPPPRRRSTRTANSRIATPQWGVKMNEDTPFLVEYLYIA